MEKNLNKNIYTYTDTHIYESLCYIPWNLYNVVNQLYFNKKYPYKTTVTDIDSVDLVFIMCLMPESGKTFYIMQLKSVPIY